MKMTPETIGRPREGDHMEILQFMQDMCENAPLSTAANTMKALAAGCTFEAERLSPLCQNRDIPQKKAPPTVPRV